MDTLTDDVEWSGIRRVLIAVRQPELAQPIQSTVKDLGAQSMIFEDLDQLSRYIASIKELPDLIVTSVFSDTKSVIHLLLSFLTSPSYRKLRVCLLYEKGESWIIPACFEMGLTACMPLPMNQNKLQAEFSNFFGLAVNYSRKPFMVSYEFFKKFSQNSEYYEDLSEVLESLIEVYPDNPQFYIDLAENYYLSENYSMAKKTLQLAKFQKHSLKLSVQQLEDMLNEETEDDGCEREAPALSGIKNCVIVDPDEASVNQLTKIVSVLDFSEIKVFGCAKDVLTFLNVNTQPALILLEWNYPDSNGVQLVQRIRALCRKKLILAVVSSLVKPEDKMLLKEMGVSAVILKPCQHEQVISSVLAVLRCVRCPQEEEEINTAFQSAVLENDLPKMKNIVTRSKSSSLLPESNLTVFQAQISLSEGKYDQAKKFVFKAFRSGAKNLQLYSIMGNILLKLGDKQSALMCFEKGHQISPRNISRLCQISEIQSELGNTTESRQSLEQAAEIDPDNEEVKCLKSSAFLSSGDISGAAQTMKSIKSLKPLFAMMNNKAAILAQQGKTAESIAIYRNTINAVPDEETSEKCKLFYNLALAFARSNMEKDAIDIIEKNLSDHVPEDLNKKVTSLLSRLRQAQKTGRPVTLNLTQTISQDTSSKDRPVALDVNPGDYGLHQIYEADRHMTKKVRDLITKFRSEQLKKKS